MRAVGPILCAHDDNPVGVRLKLQVSLRERPVLPVVAITQIPQEYFELLGPRSVICR